MHVGCAKARAAMLFVGGCRPTRPRVALSVSPPLNAICLAYASPGVRGLGPVSCAARLLGATRDFGGLANHVARCRPVRQLALREPSCRLLDVVAAWCPSPGAQGPARHLVLASRARSCRCSVLARRPQSSEVSFAKDLRARQSEPWSSLDEYGCAGGALRTAVRAAGQRLKCVAKRSTYVSHIRHSSICLYDMACKLSEVVCAQNLRQGAFAGLGVTRARKRASCRAFGNWRASES